MSIQIAQNSGERKLLRYSHEITA